MAREAGDDLVGETRELLEPGDIDLHGVIVYTDYGRNDETRMHAATAELGERIAVHAGEAGNTYVYSGNDNSAFSTNQHQGLTLEDDAFVWECQQLLRDGTFDIVFYFDAAVDLDSVVDDIRAAGYDATGVRVA